MMFDIHARVLIVQRRLTAYRVPLFERMHRRLAAAGVRLQVIYGTPTPAEKMREDQGSLSWGIPIPCHYFPLGESSAVLQHIPIKLVEQQDLVVLPHENGMLNNYFLLLTRNFHQTKLAFWGHGANFQAQGRNRLRERFKSWTAGMSHWWFAYTALSAERLVENGFPAQRITWLNNSIDTDELLRWRDSVVPQELDVLRMSLGLLNRRVGVFIGSLHRDKRIDFLLEASQLLQKLHPDFALLIIGDGPLLNQIKDFAASRPWCIAVGARHGREKGLHLALGDVMLNPGMVGLGILDSFVMGLPMVTTDCGIHSPEIAYLESDANGLMTADNLPAFVEGIRRVLDDEDLRERLVRGCHEASSVYTLDLMVENFCDGILSALELPLNSRHANEELLGDRGKNISLTERGLLPEWHIAIIWQRFLPYHVARLRRLQERCAELGYRLTAIEAASQDASYSFGTALPGAGFDHICCFPGTSYHDHDAAEIHGNVLAALNHAQPDVVFAPATPFPEGMAAVVYRQRTGTRTIMMDDAWELTDRRGAIVSAVKRRLHSNIDGVFVPAESHAPYYRSLGFPQSKILFGVDVVDNDYFATGADRVRANATVLEVNGTLVADYFLFVGRFLPRKGLETLLAAYARYRTSAESKPWDLFMVGGGSCLDDIRRMGTAIEGVHFAGPQFGDDLCRYYGLAKVLIVPSESDPWGLVVNEGLASGLPVIVSSGCGAARTLVAEGENGWCFPAGDVVTLTQIMLRAGNASPAVLAQMGSRSRQIISEWSLDRFADGVFQAMELSRSMPGGILANLATRLWKGRVSVN